MLTLRTSDGDVRKSECERSAALPETHFTKSPLRDHADIDPLPPRSVGTRLTAGRTAAWTRREFATSRVSTPDGTTRGVITM